MNGRPHRRRRDEAGGAVPELVDLFRLAAGAGAPVSTSVVLVAPRAPEPVRAAMDDASGRLRRGLPLAEVLAALGEDLGAEAAPLVDALARSAATGASAVDLLDAVAAQAHDRRRRRAEEAARRLPVTMLLPLALCILPAAVVLAVVPVLVASLRSLAP